MRIEASAGVPNALAAMATSTQAASRRNRVPARLHPATPPRRPVIGGAGVEPEPPVRCAPARENSAGRRPAGHRIQWPFSASLPAFVQVPACGLRFIFRDSSRIIWFSWLRPSCSWSTWRAVAPLSATPLRRCVGMSDWLPSSRGQELATRSRQRTARDALVAACVADGLRSAGVGRVGKWGRWRVMSRTPRAGRALVGGAEGACVRRASEGEPCSEHLPPPQLPFE